MEEQVGALWHRIITRLVNDRYPEAAVQLDEVRSVLGIYFRALGGDGGLQIEPADATSTHTRRNWLQRMAGSHRRVELAWRDERSLRLPIKLDWFAQQFLNRDLYFWLAALAVNDQTAAGTDWFTHNQRLTCDALSAWPGLRPRYRRLVDAHLALRAAPDTMKPDQAARERAIRVALLRPGDAVELPLAEGDPAPVPLWLHPSPPEPKRPAAGNVTDKDTERNGISREPGNARRKHAERIESPETGKGLITIRMENILTWGEFVRVDRDQDEEEDLNRAESILDDLDNLSIARNRRAAAASLKFDLDLPAEAEDDLVLDEGLLLPEWDWKKQQLLADACRIVHMVAEVSTPAELPAHLRKTARRLRNQFQALAPARIWHRAQSEGQEVDIDAYLRYFTDRLAGRADNVRGLYRDLRSGGRDLACFLLADLSLSTDTWINDHHRVIDVIRDSLYLFAESLSATGDRFGMYGFSSRRNNPVRLHQLKEFGERYDGVIRRRIAQIKPGYYTRLGAGIRYASRQLSLQPANRRLLLILTDGKPNDIDKYEGRYGIEDTRQAIQAARRLGLQPFCVTIDRRGNDYLPHLFGNRGYVVIHDPAELPGKLPRLYAQLTA